MNDLTITISKNINAPIEAVFDAWLDPKTLALFMLPMPGMKAPEVTNNPVVNGEFSIIMHVGDDDMAHTGRYLEINRSDKLVFTWESAFSPKGSTVTLVFKPVNSGETHVELTHTKFIDEESKNNHHGGWTNILDLLNTTVK